MSNFLFNADAFETFSAVHAVGLQFGKMFALFGAGFSIGRNFMRVINTKVRSGVAMSNVIRDTIISFVVGYVSSGLISGIVNSSVGRSVTANLGVTPSTDGITDGGEAAASALSVAANNLVETVQGGIFGLMSTVGFDVGNTAIGSTLSGTSSIFGTMGPSIVVVVFGAIIGSVVSLIFER